MVFGIPSRNLTFLPFVNSLETKYSRPGFVNYNETERWQRPKPPVSPRSEIEKNKRKRVEEKITVSLPL